MDKYFHPTLYQTYDYLSMLGLRLYHVSKGAPRLIGILDKFGQMLREILIPCMEGMSLNIELN